MAFLAGEKLGFYSILSPLGSGGMGEVYRALDSRMGREVALKLVPAVVASDPDRRWRFEQEIRAAAALNHPNIAAIFDAAPNAEPPWLVMELVPGESLRSLLSRGAVPVRKVVEIATQIASGLAAAHTAGIVHRDLKPENIMLTPDGLIKVLDFGVARLAHLSTAIATNTATMLATLPGQILGTCAYMSPEQARAEAVDHTSDQFSFGLV